jgi:hypothetical protein
MTPEVDLVVNCYERTYRDLLVEGHFPARAAEQRHEFASRTVLINNVEDRDDARRRAEALVATGEIDRFYFVADRLAEALATTGLTSADLGRIPYFTDFALVAVTLPGPDWMLHLDPEIRMRRSVPWIAPAIELMERDGRVLVANPNWPPPTLARETIEDAGAFALGHGFSDQIFLVRRRDMARPIYGERCVARLRYPLAHVADIFEARVDAHMRHHGRLRATHREATYEHPLEIGAAYPARSVREKARLARNRLVIGALRHSPVGPACTRSL